MTGRTRLKRSDSLASRRELNASGDISTLCVLLSLELWSTVSVILPLELCLTVARTILLSLELSLFYDLCTTVATTVSVLPWNGQPYGSAVYRTVSVRLSLYRCCYNYLFYNIAGSFALWFYCLSNCLSSTVSVPLPLQLSLFYSRADSFMVLLCLELSQFYCLCTTVATTVSVLH